MSWKNNPCRHMQKQHRGDLNLQQPPFFCKFILIFFTGFGSSRGFQTSFGQENKWETQFLKTFDLFSKKKNIFLTYNHALLALYRRLQSMLVIMASNIPVSASTEFHKGGHQHNLPRKKGKFCSYSIFKVNDPLQRKLKFCCM